jgi:hypothetical protein
MVLKMVELMRKGDEASKRETASLGLEAYMDLEKRNLTVGRGAVLLRMITRTRSRVSIKLRTHPQDSVRAAIKKAGEEMSNCPSQS